MKAVVFLPVSGPVLQHQYMRIKPASPLPRNVLHLRLYVYPAAINDAVHARTDKHAHAQHPRDR